MKWDFPFEEEGGEGGSKMFESAGFFFQLSQREVFLSLDRVTDQSPPRFNFPYIFPLSPFLTSLSKAWDTDRTRKGNKWNFPLSSARDWSCAQAWTWGMFEFLFFAFFAGNCENYFAPRKINQLLTYWSSFLLGSKNGEKVHFCCFFRPLDNEKWKRDEIAWRFVNFFYLFQTDVCTSSFEKKASFSRPIGGPRRGRRKKRKRKKKCTHAPCFPNPASEYEYSPRAKIPPAPKKLRPPSIKVLFFPRKKKREKKNSSSLGKGEEEEETNFPGQGHCFPLGIIVVKTNLGEERKFISLTSKGVSSTCIFFYKIKLCLAFGR